MSFSCTCVLLISSYSHIHIYTNAYTLWPTILPSTLISDVRTPPSPTQMNKWTPLHWAVHRNRTQVVRLCFKLLSSCILSLLRLHHWFQQRFERRWMELPAAVYPRSLSRGCLPATTLEAIRRLPSYLLKTCVVTGLCLCGICKCKYFDATPFKLNHVFTQSPKTSCSRPKTNHMIKEE